MEKLGMASFLKIGHPYHLYVYDEVPGVPAGVTIKDASTILSPDKIFKYKDHDNYAGFANLFRYKLILEKGNYWVDTDMICLKPFDHTTDYVFSSERSKHPTSDTKIQVNTGVIEAPIGSAIMVYCYSESARKDHDTLKWGETGPLLLMKAVKKFDMGRYVANPEAFCPVNWWDWNQVLERSPDMKVLAGSQAVHLWNEMWRRHEVDKSGTFDESCLYEQLKKVYLNT